MIKSCKISSEYKVLYSWKFQRLRTVKVLTSRILKISDIIISWDQSDQISLDDTYRYIYIDYSYLEILRPLNF